VSGSGHARPRASTVVTIAIVATTPVLAAILSTREPERLYSGLSALVSIAADGRAAAALVSFGALDLILDPDLPRRVQEPEATPSLAWAGRETFARSLTELIDTALSLDALTVHACAASMETMGLEPEAVTERGLDGVKSTPRFLKDAGEATLLFV
jgi:peroxiredoxin family protein